MPPEQGTRADLAYGTIPRLLLERAAKTPDRLALVDGGVSLTFVSLAGRVRAVTKALLGSGIAPGDRVAIWAPNMWEWVVVALGVHSAGGVVVPINTRYKGHEAAYILEKSGARLLFTVTGFLDTDYVSLLREAGALPSTLEAIVVLRGEAPSGTFDLASFLSTRRRDVNDTQTEKRMLGVAPDDLADILFTSGTTGKPKGAMCTHAQNLRAFGDWSDVIGLRDDDRYLVVLPFFHSFGYKAGWLASLIVGATVFPEPVFDVGRVLDRVARDRITMLPGPPALYQSILARDDLDRHDLSSLRLAVTGAAVVPVDLVRKMRSVLGFETVITGYGLTETCGIVTMCRHDDDPETIAQTSGRAIPGVEVRAIDAEGNALPPDTPGEIVVRGYNVMKGYFDADEETRATIDADGWLHTGDVGTLDARGYIRITDRIKDMFIVGGFNAYPAEIEALLLAHESIAEAAVIGVPDERLGEVGMAFVVSKKGAEIDEAGVIAWARERMANFKVPRYVRFVDARPRNATGKVTKFALRDLAR